ncbi:MAG: class I SAM-dependent methyltransferase [Prolixibacteraceae bacterium]
MIKLLPLSETLTALRKTSCPNCRGRRIENFFNVRHAPSKSLITIKNRRDALAIPRRKISLAFCNDCGFIFNSTFDRSLDHYTQGYEDQQGFSGTFRKFLTEVSGRVIEKYQVFNKDIIEIGCGKGDFLSLICELGNNRGIGIDPAYVPGRLSSNPNLKFIREFYSVGHRHLPKDLISCRHTLEHIPLTHEFISTVRRSIGGDEKVILFFEVPNVTRILKVQAFWDIFYEHCSYFSPGSLARLFRQNYFEVLDLYLEYDNQYLFIEARPVSEKSTRVHPLEESVDKLRASLSDFTEKIGKQLSVWRERLIRFQRDHKTVVIWGGGSKSVGFLTQFDDLKLIRHVVDINPHMQGNFIPGIGIQYISPDALKEVQPDIVLVMNGVYREEIRKMLNERDLFPELICLD